MSRRFRAAVQAALLLAACLAPRPAAAEANVGWPTQVDALYTLHFTGFGELGKFRYQSQINGAEYTISGNAEVKVPLIYQWSSVIGGSGRIAGQEAKPTTYTFSSKSKPVIGRKKHLDLALGFKDRNVVDTRIDPPDEPTSSHYVPLKPEHLKSVIDPLTAVLAITRANGGQPCGRKLEIFDGKQRFDLVTSPAGQQRVPEARPSGQPTIGHVCKVRYVPVAGFKDTENFRSILNTTTAEIALRPVPSANLLVPYRVTVATKWGTASMVLHRMDIVTPGQKQIALIH